MNTLRNSVQLIGHLGAEPEVRILENGSKVAQLRMATKESYKTQSGEWKEETTWHTVVGWNQLAERMQQQLTKGSFVLIEGKLTNRNYTDATGIKRYFTEVLAVNMMRLDKKTSENNLSESEVPEEVHDDGLPF